MLLREQRSDVVAELLKKEWEENYVQNKRWILARDNALARAIEKGGRDKGPAMVVGAGPSVNKNLKDLDHELYTIYAADKMCPRLVDMGIYPEVVCALNAAHTDVAKWLEPANKRGVKLIVPCGVNPEAHEAWEGEVIFVNAVTPTGLHERVQAECHYSPVVIGSNVGTMCYTMATHFGHNPIAYIGLDFSFLTRDEVMKKYITGYTDGVELEYEPGSLGIQPKSTKPCKIPIYSKQYHIIEMTDINDEVRWLDIGWWDMSQAFQEKVRDFKQFYGVRTINCTEGGINYSDYCGAMTLKEFNEKLRAGDL